MGADARERLETKDFSAADVCNWFAEKSFCFVLRMEGMD
jgi:hypothetical protein